MIPQEYRNTRRLTPREYVRLQGFSDNFLILVSDNQAYKQFKNSVATPLNNENLGVPLSGQAFHFNFCSYLTKGFPLQALTQNLPHDRLSGNIYFF
ncbi:DNA cytosine methyltransferase [Runella sp.]|uniref:DNA cytosine methyltransferase n=1 Tax=Runella sp. TaxID=1960881 RepID=UPI00261F24FB|nr:DNA cytosine methyltransferase [Runella sp.]